MKILTIIGARPQFIKAAMLSRMIKNDSRCREIIVHTGQHFDKNMSEIFFKDMQIPQPKYNLNINSLTHGEMTGRMLADIEKILIKEKPDIAIVYGDTNSTLAGALAAKKLHITLAHVEAGLRSYNMAMPEEINRIVTDRIADVLFCPTARAVRNLKQEGFDNFNCKIVKNGDVMYDAAKYYTRIASEKSTIIEKLKLKDFVLCTFHREENTDNYTILKSIVTALNRINKEITVVLPVHPRTRKVLRQQSLKIDALMIDPVGYLDMIQLLKHCKLVMTDSGGLQKEAFFFQKHCVTLREQTEWIELVEHGLNKVTGTDVKNIYSGYKEMLDKKSDFNLDLYGNGNAAETIVNTLKEL